MVKHVRLLAKRATIMKCILHILLLLFIAVLTAPAADDWDMPFMPVSEIKPGMTGTGKTVFSGNDIEEFGVQVLDIIKDFYPQRDVILVRLTGEKMEYIGVAGGMSITSLCG